MPVTCTRQPGKSKLLKPRVPMDTLTFSHKVIHRASTAQEDEFSKLLQKRLNIVRRAFQVLGAKVTGKGPVSIL